MNLTEEMASFVVDTKLEQVPQKALQAAENAFVDTVGVMLAGHGEQASQIAIEFARSMGGTPQSSIVGETERVSVTEAAWANGIMAHVLDYDDWGVWGHASSILVPGVLAAAEKEHASGSEALLAYIVGYEVGARLAAGFTYSGDSVATTAGDQVHGLHRTPVFGTLAAAAACARVMNLDVHGTQMALGIAASHVGGVMQNFGTMTKPLHIGSAARSGVLAAELVKRGFTAATNVIEGDLGFCHAVLGSGNYDLSVMGQGLGVEFYLSKGREIKLYPSCGGNHLALDALFRLIAEHRIRYDDIDLVEAELDGQQATSLRYHRPATGLEGKFSLEYNLAAALLDRSVDLDTFADDRVLRPEAEEAMEKIRVTVHPEWPSGIRFWHSPVTITLRGGKRVSDPGERLRGSSSFPLTEAELAQKYRSCAATLLAPGAVEESLETLQDLQTLSDVSELMRLLANDQAPAPTGRVGDEVT